MLIRRTSTPEGKLGSVAAMARGQILPDYSDDQFLEQYIAVLLELYCTELENPDQGPISRGRVRYWEKVVRVYERMVPGDVNGRVLYRTKRAEKCDLTPVEKALLRYAWTAQLAALEREDEVLRRWQGYLDGASAAESTVVFPADAFDKRRRFRESVILLQDSGYWPWSQGNTSRRRS